MKDLFISLSTWQKCSDKKHITITFPVEQKMKNTLICKFKARLLIQSVYDGGGKKKKGREKLRMVLLTCTSDVAGNQQNGKPKEDTVTHSGCGRRHFDAV